MATWAPRARATGTGDQHARPDLRRRVRAATAAIAVIGSSTGIGDESRSENQIESISVRSQRSMSRQKKSAPSPGGPTGHGPA